MVEIDFDVALRPQLQVEERVLGEEGQHVVEERDAGGDLRPAAAVDVEPEVDVGFARDPVDPGAACLAHGRH